MTYFPTSPIPAWPKRSRLGGQPLREFIFDQVNIQGHDLRAAGVRMRSHLYQGGNPLTCIQCGRSADADGNVHCGH
jgi:hypothetical protein